MTKQWHHCNHCNGIVIQFYVKAYHYHKIHFMLNIHTTISCNCSLSLSARSLISCISLADATLLTINKIQNHTLSVENAVEHRKTQTETMPNWCRKVYFIWRRNAHIKQPIIKTLFKRLFILHCKFWLDAQRTHRCCIRCHKTWMRKMHKITVFNTCHETMLND